MNTGLILLTTAVIVQFAFTYGTRCLTDAGCASDECCNNYHGPLIASKRQLAQLTLANDGVCEKYQKLGDYCSAISKMNGHCSCGPGLECAFIPAKHPSTFAVGGKRSMIFPGLGEYRCVLHKMTLPQPILPTTELFRTYAPSK